MRYIQGRISHFIFLRESRFYSSVVSRKWDAEMREFYTSRNLVEYCLCIICPLLLINGIDVTILWTGLAKRSKEISCLRNLISVAACDFYDARWTFYASSYENLVEKSARHASVLSSLTFFMPLPTIGVSQALCFQIVHLWVHAWVCPSRWRASRKVCEHDV